MTEYIQGKPFLGEAGRELAKILAEVRTRTNIQPDYVITNSVLCTPFTDDTRTLIETPTKEQTKACSSLLYRLYKLVQPKEVVALGQVSHKSLEQLGIEHTHVFHPSYILQTHPKNYHLDFERTVNALIGVYKKCRLTQK